MEDTILRPKLYFEAYNLNKALDKTKLVQKAKDILNDKLRIRNAYLKAYGGVTQVSTDTSDDKNLEHMLKI